MHLLSKLNYEQINRNKMVISYNFHIKVKFDGITKLIKRATNLYFILKKIKKKIAIVTFSSSVKEI